VAPLEDYFFEKPAGDRPDDRPTRQVRDALDTAHCAFDNGAFRRILFDVQWLDGILISAQRPLHVRVTAMPEFCKNGDVGFSTYGYGDTDSIPLPHNEAGKFLQPDRTLPVTLRVKRHQSEGGSFTFKPLE
jgi:hypothetical protein